MQTILAVDDEEENLLMVENTLSNEYRVVAVNSGFMALKYLHQEIPDLILLDIKMPQMDGFEVLNAIRSNENWMKIPVIFLSSYTKAYTDDELMQSGVADYIGKPVDTNVMRCRIRNAMFQMREDVRNNRLQFKPLEKREEVRDRVETKRQPSVPVVIDNIETELQADKIMYIEAFNNDCVICTKHMEVKVRMPLDKIQALLGSDFLRTGRSMLINMSFVRSLGDGTLTMENGKIIKLPRRNKKELSAKVLDVLSKKVK